MSSLPGLVLLHGVGDSGECMQPLVRALDLPGLRAWTPSSPAHGGNPGQAGVTVAWPRLAAAARDSVSQAVAITGGPVVLGGHSMGAALALYVAATHPELVQSLFLEDPPFLTGPDEEPDDPGEATDLSQLHAWFAGLQTATLAELVDTARHEHPGWPDDEYEPWARAKLQVVAEAFSQPVPWLRAGYANLVRMVRCPTVVLSGEVDHGGLVCQPAAEFLASQPNWRVHRVPGAGHDVRRDNRALAVAELRGLLLAG